MKKYLLIIVVIAIVSSCKFLQKEDLTPITSIVANVEWVVQKQDNIVQSSIDSEKFEYIIPTSDLAIDSIKVQIEKLQQLEVKEEQAELKNSAIKYIQSMENVIKSLKEYSILTDSTTLVEANKIDLKNSKAIDEAEEASNKYKLALDAFK